MLQTREIAHLTEKIRIELEHFIPCVRSEMEAKHVISKHLKEIRTLTQEIQEHKCAKGCQSPENYTFL